MKDRELKPCPFCGGKAKIIEVADYSSTGGSYWNVLCKLLNCCAQYGETKRQAISAWNKRSYRLLGEEELEKILRGNIDCEYHHRTQIKKTVQAIINARSKNGQR